MFFGGMKLRWVNKLLPMEKTTDFTDCTDLNHLSSAKSVSCFDNYSLQIFSVCPVQLIVIEHGDVVFAITIFGNHEPYGLVLV